MSEYALNLSNNPFYHILAVRYVMYSTDTLATRNETSIYISVYNGLYSIVHNRNEVKEVPYCCLAVLAYVYIIAG